MATKNRTANLRRRASQRDCLEINLAECSLKALMVEHCRSDGGWITAYRGTRAALMQSGVPEAAFPDAGGTKQFQVQTLNVCSTGSRELLQGAMRHADRDTYEMEIDWGYVKPYYQGEHPALGELARMLLKDVLSWTDVPGGKDAATGLKLARPLELLALDPRSDYKPGPGDPRLQVTPEFYKRLRDAALALSSMVHEYGEVTLAAPPEVPDTRQKPVLRLIPR